MSRFCEKGRIICLIKRIMRIYAQIIFVIAKNEKNILLNSYIPIERNKMFINNSAKVITKAEDCPVTIGNPDEIKGSYWDPSYTNPDDEYDHSRPVAFTVAYLNGVTTTEVIVGK